MSDVEDRVNRVESLLNDYEKSIGLVLEGTDEASKYLNLTEDQLRKMSAEECGSGAYMLGRTSTFIQREINHHQRRMNWANSSIDHIVVPVLSQYGGQYTSAPHKRIMAIQENPLCTSLQQLVVQAQLRIDTLAYIVMSVNNMSNHLSELGKSKRRERTV